MPSQIAPGALLSQLRYFQLFCVCECVCGYMFCFQNNYPDVIFVGENNKA